MSHGRSHVVLSALIALALVTTGACGAISADAAASAAPNEPVDQSVVDEANRSDGDAASDEHPRIVGLYPNPVADGDTGEYVVLDVPAPTNLTGLTLGDGDRDLARLPNETAEETIAVSVDPAVATNRTEKPVVALAGRLRLANGGERVVLRQNGTRIDAARYGDAPEGELWRRDGAAATPSGGDAAATAASSGTWSPLGATDFEPITGDPDAVTAFALPDAPTVPVERIERADERVLLAGYTFTDERVAEALIAANERGVRVDVLVDGAPVGGVPAAQHRALDRLVGAGIDVSAVGGERARYRYHHPKYAVLDDEALVMTENWKPSGTGGHSSRGWGVVVHGEETAASLRAVFDADAAGRGAVPWSKFRTRVEAVETTPANGTFPRRIEPRRFDADSVRLIAAPDNAEGELRRLLADADESILIEQVSIERETPLVDATLDAARRGVSVKVLLSSAWYVEAENRKLAGWLERRAAAEDLDLRVRLAEPRGRYEKLHSKGIVVDEESAVIGSINWNNNSLRKNREIAVIVEGDNVGEYYAGLFHADWTGGVERLPVGLAAALGGVGIVSVGVTRRRVTFE
ncbi:Phosphatidylserine/phosphatidylglycerophosphate/cardiolipin synthase [Natronoarchaeum philippinense]|uniref:Phosphatidylserine/phosphatidylglycerophosphate/cardiolipin synthase n=1 Tax=Natronoarchaeum philippinense TaxID=558529 RepID=A0A285N3U0_NATPI|nr:phospholipase D-like domain-containing protein [Natronoarchaeum philippinense]SNZ02411.1 Phosphatidylserine/phosphatidylglycerophosphate/cardiolipin synthase [Natronoarchaeum philippinense]